jgi:hypothetical protein
MFEVGKKYTDGDLFVAECVYISEGMVRTAVLEYEDGSIDVEDAHGLGDWTEYKEPVTITRYAVVYTPQGGDKPAMLLCSEYTSEQAARNLLWPGHTIHQIIPVTATIEG